MDNKINIGDLGEFSGRISKKVKVLRVDDKYVTYLIIDENKKKYIYLEDFKKKFTKEGSTTKEETKIENKPLKESISIKEKINKIKEKVEAIKKPAYTLVGVYVDENGYNDSEDLNKKGLRGYRIRYNKEPNMYGGYVQFDLTQLDEAQRRLIYLNEKAEEKKEFQKIKDAENKIKREENKILEKQKLEAATKDIIAKPSYLMTLSEYQERVVPILSEYQKFLRKNSEYLEAADYDGIYKYTYPELEKDFENKTIKGRKFAIDKYQENPLQSFKASHYPEDEIIEKNKSFVNKLKNFFTDEEIYSLITKDEFKSNKNSVKRAIDNDTYKNLLENNELSEQELETIAKSVDVKIPKKVFSLENVKAKEMRANFEKLLSGLPTINKEELKKLIESVESDFKPLEEELFILEKERYTKIFKSFVEKEKVYIDNLERTINIWENLFSYDKTGYDKIKTGRYQRNYYTRQEEEIIDEKKYAIGLKLKSNWETTFDKFLKAYIDTLKYSFVNAIIKNFTRITKPIKEVVKLEIKRGDKGFEGEYRFKFDDGSYFDFKAEAIRAGGYNIQVLHLRYITNFLNITLADGTKVTGYSNLIENFNTTRMEKGGSVGQNITCVSCGWRWNTKDSDESDKYVCHKCGFDNTTFYSSDIMGNGGQVKNMTFMKWITEYNKNNSDEILAFFSLPSEYINPSLLSENNIILDVFEKQKDNIDAKKHFQKILNKADELSVTIYLKPIPRVHKLKSEAHKKKITKDYLIQYYNNFGFVEDKDDFMVRQPKMSKGGGVEYVGRFQKDFESLLKDEGWYISYFDKNANEVDKEKADNISVFTFEPNYESVRIKLPSKMLISFEWVMNKVNSDNLYKNFSENFNKLLKQKGFENVGLYPTTYGIGLTQFTNTTETKDKIKNLLDTLGIDYITERSEGGYVYRFIISKSKKNIDKIIALDEAIDNTKMENGGLVAPKKYLYHKSNPFFRDNILKQGLIPKGKSDSWLSNTKIKGKVIFATNSDKEKDWFDTTYDDDIYQIDTTNLKNKWYLDPNFKDSKYVITFEPIEKSAIKLIYKGTGESYKDGGLTNDDIKNKTDKYKNVLKKPSSLLKISEMHKVPIQFLQSQLIKGMKVESEHTNREVVAKIIALHHLEENPNYYIKLEKMENNKMAHGGTVKSKIFKGYEIGNDSVYKKMEDGGEIWNPKNIQVGDYVEYNKYFYNWIYTIRGEVLEIINTDVYTGHKDFKIGKAKILIKTKFGQRGALPYQKTTIIDVKHLGKITKDNVPYTQLADGGMTEDDRENEENYKLVELSDAVYRAQKNIAYASDADQAIAEFYMARKVYNDFQKSIDDRKDSIRRTRNIDTLIETEKEYFEKYGDNYEYKELFEKSPILAALQSAKDLLEWTISDDSREIEKKEGYSDEEIEKTIKRRVGNHTRDIKDLEYFLQQKESKTKKKKLAEGGEIDPDNKSIKSAMTHKAGSAGGLLVGNRHSEGGIKAVNKSTDSPLEMEGGEVVITRNAVSDDTKREFEGKMLTNRQILSKINESGGGVSFADGGNVPSSCKCSGKSYKYGGEMISDYEIIKKINQYNKK